MEKNSLSIVFFDGHCTLCNGFVNFLFKWDKNNIYKVASIQGKSATKYLSQGEINECSSIILIEENKKIKKSKAVIKILSKLPFPWKLIIIFNIIPSFISDLFYDPIAKYRYKLFGRKDHCRIPNEEEKQKMLD